MKRIIHATLIISTVLALLVTSCKKEVSNASPSLPNALTVAGAKSFYEQTVVVQEQARNKKAAPLSIEDVGIFKRMEKLGQEVQWDNPQEFANGKISYLAFSLNEKDRELRTGNKMHRTFVFSKLDGKIRMQICETMGGAMSSATILSQIKAALENHEMQKITAVSSGSANLYFYSDRYRSDFSCRITNGKLENTNETIKLSFNKESAVESIAANSNSQTCQLWGCFQIWWEDGVRHEYLLYTYNVCTPASPAEEELPDGEGGGGDDCDYTSCIADFDNLVTGASSVSGVQISASGSIPTDGLDYEQQYPWKVVDGGPAFSFKSIEIATLTELGGNTLHPYQFKSVRHTPVAFAGLLTGGTALITSDVASWIPGLYVYGVNVSLTVKYSPLMCCGLPGPLNYDLTYQSQSIMKAP